MQSYSCAVLNIPRRVQDVDGPRIVDSWDMKMAKLVALHTRTYR